MNNADRNKDDMRCCRDCMYFEERRGIDKVVLCEKNQISEVCCSEIEFRDKDLNDETLYNFCLECMNFENVVGIPRCIKYHSPRIACKFLTDSYRERNLVSGIATAQPVEKVNI